MKVRPTQKNHLLLCWLHGSMDPSNTPLSFGLSAILPILASLGRSAGARPFPGQPLRPPKAHSSNKHNDLWVVVLLHLSENPDQWGSAVCAPTTTSLLVLWDSLPSPKRTKGRGILECTGPAGWRIAGWLAGQSESCHS